MKKPEARLGNSQDLISELEAAAKSVVGSSDEPLHGYIATALTGVEEDTREAIAFVSSTIANACKRFEIYVYQPRKVSDPLLNPDLKPETVYSTDRKRVLAADLLIV